MEVKVHYGALVMAASMDVGVENDVLVYTLGGGAETGVNIPIAELTKMVRTILASQQ